MLPFQLAGCAYQPPAGDQTCLGYLCAVRKAASEALAVSAHGIFPPPPIVKCSCGDIWGGCSCCFDVRSAVAGEVALVMAWRFPNSQKLMIATPRRRHTSLSARRCPRRLFVVPPPFAVQLRL